MKLNRQDFGSREQWSEHHRILKFPNVRCHNLIETGNSMFVFYKQGLADNAFIVEYHAEGGTTLFFCHASLATLKELLSPSPRRTQKHAVGQASSPRPASQDGGANDS